MQDNKGNLVIPSCAGLLDCFNTRKNEYGGKQQSICYLIELENSSINILFIITVFSYIYYNCNTKDNCTYTFKISKLKSFRSQVHGSKSLDIKEELLKLNDIGCWFADSDIDKLATVEIEGKTAIIESQYFYELIKAMDYLTLKPNGKHSPSYSSLVGTGILSERNHSAIEIVIELCKLVERRGGSSREDVTSSHIAVSTLIDRCSILRGKIENASTISRKNQILRDDIEKAQELLRKKTRIYEEFESLELVMPERLAVNKQSVIIINHRGRRIENEEDSGD